MVVADDDPDDERLDPQHAAAAAALRRRLYEVAMLIADAVTHRGIGIDLLQTARARIFALLRVLDELIASWLGVPTPVEDVPTAPLDNPGAPR